MSWDSGNDDLKNRADVKRAQENQPLENGLEGFFPEGTPTTQPVSTGFGGFGSVPTQDAGSSVDGFGTVMNNGSNPVQSPPPADNNGHRKDFSEVSMEVGGKAVRALGSFLAQFIPYVNRMFRDAKLLNSFSTFWLVLNMVFFLTSFLFNVFLGSWFQSWVMIGGSGAIISLVFYVSCLMFKGRAFAVDGADDESKSDDSGSSDSDFGSGGSTFQPSTPVGVSTTSTGGWGEVTPVEITSTSDSYDYVEDEVNEDDWGDDDWGDDDWGDDDWGDDEVVAPIKTFDGIAVTVSSGSSEVTLADDSAFNEDVAGASMGADMVTRRGLLDKYLSVLDSSGTKADDVRKIDASSDEAQKIENFLNGAVEGMALSQEDWVSITSIEERTVIFRITTTRPNKLKGKEQRFAEELTKVLRDRMSRELGKSVYATAEGVGNEILINIFKGIGAKVYLKDVMLQNKEFFENPKNILPVTFGFNEFGEPILGDLSKMVHTMFSGNPGSGKSNLASAVVDQLVALNSPKQVQFIVGDAKDGISDWKMFRVPHFKRFESSLQGIVDLLDWVVEVEEPRRVKLLSSLGVIKIQDYNEISDTPLPYLFVILDEVMTFANSATPEQKAQYKRSLGIIVSKMRAVGIFLIAVPHRVVDSVFPATASALFGNRFAVKADEEITKTVWKDSYRKINFSISNVGDFAYTLDADNEPRFGHAPLLMDGSGRTAKLYEQQRKMWSSLYPDEVVDSYYFLEQQRAEQGSILNKAGINVSESDMRREDEFKSTHDDSWMDEYN